MQRINILNKKVFASGGILVLSLMLANFLNFVFNAYLGRVLTIENFGLVTFINTLLSLTAIFINALSSSVTHRTAFLSANVNKEASIIFLKKVKENVMTFSLFLTLLWVIAIPFSAKFFNIGDIASLLFFTPVILVSLFVGVYRGFLQGNLFLLQISLILIIEAISKLIFAFLLKQSHLESFAYISIPLSILISFILAIFFTSSKIETVKNTENKNYAFPRRFFIAAAITGLATSGFLTLDLVLVKHFLLPKAAGEYSLLSLAGKMVYFFGSLLNGLILTFVSKDIGEGKNPNNIFYKFLWGSILLTILAFVFIGILGGYFIPILFGAKALAIVPYLKSYCLAIALFTISNVFIIYHLTRHHFSFSLLSFFTSVLMIVGILFYHQDIGQIVNVIELVSMFNFIGVVSLHLIKRNGRFILRNLIDMFDVFSRIGEGLRENNSKKRILIFNWRDTKHKYSGGAEVYIHELAKRWVKKGNAVTLFCGNDGLSLRNEVIDGVQIVRRGGFYFVYFWAFWYYVLKFRGKYDVIIDTQNGIPFFTPLYAKEQVYCLMFHVHQEVFRRSLSRPLASFAAVLENRLMPWAYRKTKFITVSESSKKEIEDLDIGKAGIEIVYPGIDLKTFKPAIKSKNPLVIYIGRLQFYKSVNIFIEAAKKIIKQNKNIQFTIAGEGEERFKLQKLVEKLKLTDKITFLGKISDKEKINLYQKAWVFVNPSLKEGWGITSIEANACGTPVVASNVPGLRDSVKNPHTGYLVEYGNSEIFAHRIQKLVKSKKLRKDMHSNALKWAKNFSWDKSAEKGLEIIK